MLGKKAISLIHVAKNQLGISDEDYRLILHNICGVDSSKQLDDAGYAVLMDHFNRLGFQSTSRKRYFGHRQAMATPGQVKLIQDLWADHNGLFSSCHWRSRTH